MALQQFSRAEVAKTASRDPRKLRQKIAETVDATPANDGLATAVDMRGRALVLSNFQTDDPSILAADIRSLWEHAAETFLTIGRRIIRARYLIEQRVLTDPRVKALDPYPRQRAVEKEWQAFREQELRISKAHVSQLERVARAVDGERIGEHELPNSYATAYALTTLSNDELAQARIEGLLSKDVIKREVDEFKKRVRVAALSRLDTARLQLDLARKAMEKAQRDLQAAQDDLTMAEADAAATGAEIEGTVEPLEELDAEDAADNAA